MGSDKKSGLTDCDTAYYLLGPAGWPLAMRKPICIYNGVCYLLNHCFYEEWLW